MTTARRAISRHPPRRPLKITLAPKITPVAPAPRDPTNALAIEAAARRREQNVAGRVDLGTIDLGDGGLTTWTAQLLGDAKERCLVSCAATERLTTLAERH